MTNTFGYNFKRIRESLGWSREQAADKGNVSVSYIVGVETDNKSFGRVAQHKWAEIFGVDYREFHRQPEGQEPGIPVIAYVSAEGGVIPVSADDYPLGEGFERVPLPVGYFHQEKTDKERIYAVKIVGDSMYPTLRNGWTLYIKPEIIKHIRPDDIVIFRDETGAVYVKEIEFKNHEEIIFKSIGKGPTITKSLSDVKLIERVFFIKP